MLDLLRRWEGAAPGRGVAGFSHQGGELWEGVGPVPLAGGGGWL